MIVKEELKKKNNLSVWSPACVIHCYGQDQQNSPDWQVPKNSGNTIDLIVKEYLKTKGKYQVKLADGIDWPYNEKCANFNANK